jgi:hypothetical protein
MSHAVSGAALYVHNNPLDSIPCLNDLVKFNKPYLSCTIDFNNISLFPGQLGIIIGSYDTPFGIIYEILCSGEICIDVPADKIDCNF